MDKDTKDILEILHDMQESMVTKDDLETGLAAHRLEMNQGFTAIHAELAAIKKDVELLKEQVKNLGGYAKEIDDVMARVSFIEKHLGLDNVVAA